MIKAKFLSIDEKARLMGLINKHRFLGSIPSKQINDALKTLEKYFMGEYFFLEGQALVSIKESKKHKALDLLDDILPGLIFANCHFGENLPSELVQKLSNIPQLVDTIFELKCMGMFLDKHRIVYEPKLATGEVPEFKIIIDGHPEIYVECKSQGLEDAIHIKKFNSVVNRIMRPLNDSAFLKKAWAKGYRTEIFPSAYIHDREAGEFINCLEDLKFKDCLGSGKRITKNTVLICQPREEESKSKATIKTGSITVSDKPTQLSDRNTHSMIHAWDGIETQARRSKRRLLSEARRQLTNIPKSSVGMICIQTFGALHFLPDIEILIRQKQYDRIPLVWLCPFHEGKIVCRNEYLELRNDLFKELVK